jgi:hypothetical protein
MIKWFKKLLWVVRNFETVEKVAKDAQAAANQAQGAANRAFELIKGRTTVHADISPSRHDADVVILVGRYHNRDYVQCYTYANHLAFVDVVDMLAGHARTGTIGRIDCPPTFRAVIERELD